MEGKAHGVLVRLEGDRPRVLGERWIFGVERAPSRWRHCGVPVREPSRHRQSRRRASTCRLREMCAQVSVNARRARRRRLRRPPSAPAFVAVRGAIRTIGGCARVPPGHARPNSRCSSGTSPRPADRESPARAFRIRKGTEVLELVPSPGRHLSSELVVVIREVQERRAGRKFLPHEEQWCLRREEQQCRECAPRRRIHCVMQAVAERAVAHLVVILQADDKAVRRDPFRMRASRLAMPPRRLPGIEPPCLAAFAQCPRQCRRSRRNSLRCLPPCGAAADDAGRRPRSHPVPSRLLIRASGERPGSGHLRRRSTRGDREHSRGRMRRSSATRWRGLSSIRACVASRRRPSTRNSWIQ